MKRAGAAGIDNPRLLADAFSEFIAASAQLESSYRDLQQEVAQLSVELSKRNAELTRSLEENDRMRAALQQMIDSMPCGVLVVDAAESIVVINPEGQRLLGIRSARVSRLLDLSRISRIDFVSLQKRASIDRDIEVAVTTESGKRWLAVGRRELDCGSLKPGSTTRVPLRSIWILRDVTATKQAEQEREAARRATALAEISMILAHEIRNPLASLELFAGLIADGLTTGDRSDERQWIAHLRAGIRTLSGTVNNVLSMNGEGMPRLAAVNLAACVRSGVEFVKLIAEQASVALSFTAADETLTVLGNEDGIRQIMLNLIGNAIRHTPAGGQVSVSIEPAMGEDGKRALVEVRDSGCGIPEHVMEHLFEAGYSGTGETPGLGLAVCRRLMTRHGGEIRVARGEQQGSNFQLEFPAI
jgi:two-component system sensor histidine kinase FlrB